MLEKIKEVPFIDESKALKVYSDAGKVVLERTDKVIWASERTALKADGVNCYVEADKFLALMSEVKGISQGECLTVTLKNGASYSLPFVDVSWEAQAMPTHYEDTIKFKISDLMLCTLKNLIKPELQCIWIDQDGAVSCDFISACMSSAVKASRGFLLPPDVQELVDGRTCEVHVTGDKVYIHSTGFDIVTSRPTEGEDPWYQTLRGMSNGATGFVKTTELQEGLKRLSLFSDSVSFDGDKVTAGSNYEPFAFEAMPGCQFEIERLTKLMSTAKMMTSFGGNLLLMNEDCLFLVSPMEEA